MLICNTIMTAKDLSFNDNIWRDIHIDVFKLEG
jgi:hypothetical protein